MRFSCGRPAAALLTVLALAFAGQAALGDSHTGQSVDVVIIGGTSLITTTPCSYSSSAANVMYFTGGGCLPVSGPAGELGDFNFTPMLPSSVDATSLAPFDTAVLNMASSAMACDETALSAAAQADLVDFVASGKKLIIFDSECVPGVDYSWLPFPFTTANPGALGAPGSLTILENNLLSREVGDPTCEGTSDVHCIDVAHLSSDTDAVGDMNVMTTYDPYWCLDMSGTNAISITGPVHTYAKYPAGTDTGLIIYNGLDQDFLAVNDDSQLRQMWVQELQQPFNPSLLPCGIPVVGIKLAPETAQNEVGTPHTITATLTDLLGEPQPDIDVTFTITGPNATATGTCSANTDCTTDTNGEVSFTYTGAIVGIDSIAACFENPLGEEICSQSVSKEWIITNKPPECADAVASQALLWPPNHKFVPVEVLGVTDPDGDPVTITVTGLFQDEAVNASGSGRTAPDGEIVGLGAVALRAERVGDPKVPGNGRVYHIQFTAEDGQGGFCTGEVLVGCPHDQGQGSTPIDDGPIYDSTAVPGS